VPDGIRAEVRVRGAVQGVGFRYFVRRRATQLGVVGWVANESDGTVRAVAEGPTQAVDALLDLIRRGPPGARVDSVDVTRGPVTDGYDQFVVRVGGHRGD
jgi:acylphosphatase